MVKLLFRVIVATVTASLLAVVGVNGNATVLQTLFTVCGVVFSVSMSLLVSFHLSEIRNRKIRAGIRESIAHTRNMLLLDFGVSVFALAIALLWDGNKLRYTFFDGVVFDVMLTAVLLVAFTLCYEIFNFLKIHKLNTDVEDAIIAEKAGF